MLKQFDLPADKVKIHQCPELVWLKFSDFKNYIYVIEPVKSPYQIDSVEDSREPYRRNRR